MDTFPMKCKKCGKPVDSGAVMFRTHPQTGDFEAFHHECVECDICGIRQNRNGTFPRFDQHFIVHPECLRCEECRVGFAGPGELGIVVINFRVYHQMCIPCEICKNLNLRDGFRHTYIKPEHWTSDVGLNVQHATCQSVHTRAALAENYDYEYTDKEYGPYKKWTLKARE